MVNRRILFVDDDPNILDTFRRNLHGVFDVTTAAGGEEGLKEIVDNGPFAVVVSDYRMPGMNGVELLAKVKRIAPDTVRVMLTGQADLQAAIAAVNEGSLFRFLTKPCPTEALTSVLNTALEQFRLINAEHELLEKTLNGSVKVLSHILGLLSPEAFSHSVRIADLAKKVAARLNLNNLWEVEIAAMLSQIGCVAVPGAVLEKRYGGQVLTEIEREMLNEYPLVGKALLAGIPRLEGVAEAIYYQEKNFDGSGIPNDVKSGADIPVIARILKAVHDFDLLLKTGKSELQAINQMREQAGRYDPLVLNALIDEYGLVRQEHVYKEVGDINDIPVGAVLAEDIMSTTGMKLFAKGHEINEISKKRLLNAARLNHIAFPVKIMIKLQ